MSLIKQDAEATLLGGLVVGGRDVILAYSEKLTDDMFGYEPNRIIWAKLKEMAENKVAVDIVTLKESLTESALQAVGGPRYLASLIAGVPDDPKVESYFAIVAEFYTRRRYKELADNLAKTAETASKLDDVIQAAHSLKVASSVYSAPTVEEACDTAIEHIVKERESGFDLTWGVSGLDALMGGLGRGKLSLVGAKTSHGKTTTFCNVALNNLEKNGKAKILYSGCENIEDIPIKLASMQSNLPLDWFVKPHLITEEQLQQCLQALMRLQSFKDRLLIMSGAGPAAIRQAAAGYKPDIICLDYVQRFAVGKGGGVDDTRHAVGAIAAEMQQLALDYNAHSIVMSQMKRLDNERRKGPPELNDFKESGDLENYADNAVILWWPWRDTMQDSKYLQSEYHMIVAKNKLGPCLLTKASLDLKTMRIAG